MSPQIIDPNALLIPPAPYVTDWKPPLTPSALAVAVYARVCNSVNGVSEAVSMTVLLAIPVNAVPTLLCRPMNTFSSQLPRLPFDL